MKLSEAAARLLQSDIKEGTPITNEWYPLSDDLDLKSSLLYLPESLRLLCLKLFVGTKKEKNELKIAAVGQFYYSSCTT